MAEGLPYRSRDAASAYGNDEGENEEEEEDVDETVSTITDRLVLPNRGKGLQDGQGRHTVRH